MACEADERQALTKVVERFAETAQSQQRFIHELVAQVESSRRRDRLWRNVRTVLFTLAMFAGPLILVFAASRPSSGLVGKDYAALVRVNGVIDGNSSASAANVVNALELAFHDERAKGVVVAINSPGGSPVQADIIRERLKALRLSSPTKKVWVVGEDMMTSGAYFIAMGAEHVCADRSSVVGSIGVIQDGWGLDKLIARYGIERRVFTAGELKAQLDMFQPMTADAERKVHALLGSVHDHFKDVVRDGRGARLKADERLLFTGDVWTGEQAQSLGLIDKLCSLPAVLHDEFGVTDVKDYTKPPSLLGGLARTIGTELADRFFSVSTPRLMAR